MALAKQKVLWIGVVGVFVALMIFGAAMMGSVLGAKPKDLPVALVVLDQSAALPDGSALNVGEMVKGKLLGNTQLPIEWKLVGSEEEAREGLDNQKYYGALVLPADLSSGVLSLSTPQPAPATVKILVNEGMNTQAATAVKQVLGQASRALGSELSNQLLGQIGQRTEQLPISTAKALMTPFTTQEEIVHPNGTNNASGNAPGLLTQVMWIGSLVVSIVLFLALQKAVAGGARRGQAVLGQTAIGLVLIAAASGFVVWMASSWYGMQMADAAHVWLVLWLGGSAFFLLQSALLGWIGMPAMGLLVLLMFFSMPVLNMAPEFLPQATQDWLYSWTPLRFVASAIRNAMYFDGVSVGGSNIAVLWSVAGAFLVVLLASAARKTKSVGGAAAEAEGNKVAARA
ncbi:YhgE/Pip domain-containing protein [Cohnella faecalis]|uniref:DUF3533 domain-containing protein n=1 Tax=Cohnella faecalis TaxID=2315694 RepID=A0A398CHM6_9BACL|nr:ABC transporter permease [Cohnella faecalis]RIE01502.1 DUF3533 domain-containing protein [Cohnella faecalis]